MGCIGGKQWVSRLALWDRDEKSLVGVMDRDRGVAGCGNDNADRRLELLLERWIHFGRPGAESYELSIPTISDSEWEYGRLECALTRRWP